MDFKKLLATAAAAPAAASKACRKHKFFKHAKTFTCMHTYPSTCCFVHVPISAGAGAWNLPVGVSILKLCAYSPICPRSRYKSVGDKT